MPSELELAARAFIEADEAVRDAINGIGHKGEEHDRAIHMDPCTWDSEVHIYSPSTDCAACAGACYGTESTRSLAMGDLRHAVGMEMRPWEEPGLVAMKAQVPVDVGATPVGWPF